MSTTPTILDEQRIKIKASLSNPLPIGRGRFGRAIKIEFYLDTVSASGSFCSKIFGAIEPEQFHTQDHLLKLATGLFCNGFCSQDGVNYEWQLPKTCDEPSTAAGKERTTFVIPPKPTVTLPITPQPTPTPVGPPTGSSQSIADLPPTDDPIVVKQREAARAHINQVRDRGEQLRKKAEKIKSIRRNLVNLAASAVPSLVSSAVSKAVGGKNANTIGSLAGAFSSLAVQRVATRVSASRAQSASLSEAVSSALDDQAIANQIQTNIQAATAQGRVQTPPQPDLLNGDIFTNIANGMTASSGSAQRG